MKIKTIYILSLFIVSLLFIGCELDDPEVKQAPVGKLAGEWWVTYQVETDPGVFEDVGGGYTALLTYNTASNTGDSLWIDDVENFWEYKLKAAANAQNQSFATTESSNFYYDSNVKISNGKILEGQGLSTSGVVTDSIYFEVAFDDDDEPYGTTYIVSGVRRTGHLEDEH